MFFPSVFQHISFTPACAYTTPEGIIMKYVHVMTIILWLKTYINCDQENSLLSNGYLSPVLKQNRGSHKFKDKCEVTTVVT